MNAPPPRDTVLVGVDSSAASAAAVRWAASEAERRHARLHAIHVVEHVAGGHSAFRSDTRLELELARQAVPGRVADWVFTAGIDVDIAVSVVSGNVAAQLARETGDAVLAVIGAPGSLQHSDLPIDLAHACFCPVAVVGPLGDVTYVDVSAHSSTKGASHARA